MGKFIYLLEDDPVYSEVIGYVLTKAFDKDTIKAVKCKSEFEQEIQKKQPDLLIADIITPNHQGETPETKNGLDAVKMVHSNIPVIAMSILGEEVIDELRDYEGREKIIFFKKPFDTERLVIKAKELLNE